MMRLSRSKGPSCGLEKTNAMEANVKLHGKMFASHKKKAAKNKSLLKKLLFKFHCAPSAPWIDWLRQQYGRTDSFDFGDDHPAITPIWKDIYAQLPSLRDETKVLVGNGQMTAF
jgi:hypothetical protein